MAGTVKDRIKAVRTALKLSQREFGKRIYTSQSLLTEIEAGHLKATDRTIQLIVSQYNVSKEWILTGRGEMFSASQPDIKKIQLLEIFNELDDMLQDYLLLQSRELLKIQKKKMKKQP
jgi:transcriptional regulator with XRE-family HTH domain